MAFIFKRKKFKFLVSFEVEDLTLTPFVNGILFVKVRLANGGTFQDYTTREEVCNNRVQWNKTCQFECRIFANNSTLELETCSLRISLRKECKGGKTYQKLGYADINLSEYAGAGYTSRRYLLDSYNTKTRLDNSMIKVNISMKLQGGDPVFKAPQPKVVVLPGQEPQNVDLHPENKGAVSGSDGSVSSSSSGFDSLTRNKHAEGAASKNQKGESLTDSKKIPSITRPEEARESSVSRAVTNGNTASPSTSCQGQVPDPGHNRNNSSTSEMSKVSGYHSLGGAAHGHSRNSSYENNSLKKLEHKRSGSADAAEPGKMPYLVNRKMTSSIDQRVGSTRVDPETVIENLLKATDFQEEDKPDKQGLELYVSPDGTSTALSEHQLRDKGGKFERVVMGNR